MTNSQNTSELCPCGGPLDRFGNCLHAVDALTRLVPVRNGKAQADSWRVHGKASRAVAS